MAGLSNYLLAQMLRHFLIGITAPTPATWFLSAHIDDPDAAGSEIVGAGYARQACAFTHTPPTNVFALGPNAVETFGPAAADWGKVTWLGVYDASTSGNLLFKFLLTPAVYVASGASLAVPINSLTAGP